jgi:hypothetical protein
MRLNFFGGSKPRRNATPHPSRSRRPALEAMEGRLLLTALYSGSASVVEHGTAPATMGFQVNLTSPSTQPVTVSYQTADQTAIGGTDYVPTSGTVTIAPGDTTATIPVTVLANPAATTNLAFTLSLGDAHGAMLVTPKVAGTIVEQLTPPPASLSITNQTLNLGADGVGGTMTFTVALNEPVSTAVTVTAATRDLTARAGVDYTANSQVLNFAPGQTSAQFTVGITGAAAVATKYMLVDLTDANVSIGTPLASGTIVW